jgi:transposase
MRLRGSAEDLEGRRRRALKLLDGGLSLNEVGRRIGCAASSVMHWRDMRRRGGEKGLRVRSSPGRPHKLSLVHCRLLLKVLLEGAMASGYPTQLWTTARISEMIRKRFRVEYHPDHVGRLMHRLGWSHQKPQKRALEREEGAIRRFVRKDWPRVKKTPLGWVPTSSLPTNRVSS